MHIGYIPDPWLVLTGVHLFHILFVSPYFPQAGGVGVMVRYLHLEPSWFLVGRLVAFRVRGEWLRGELVSHGGAGAAVGPVYAAVPGRGLVAFAPRWGSFSVLVDGAWVPPLPPVQLSLF